MADADLVLRFEIEEGQTPNAENVANALLAWIDLLKAASEVIAPGTRLEVGLAGVEDGSDIFKLTLDRLEGFAENLKGGAEEYPLISKAAMALAGLIGGTLVVNAITPDPRIPPDQMDVFNHQTELLQESVDLQKQQMRFYGIMHDEPAFKTFEVIRPYDSKVIYSIPKVEFAERSGLWSGDIDETPAHATETRTATWDVILIKPVLVPEPRRWGFARDGIEFSALMSDKAFLEAIHNNSLPVRMAEGIRMKLEVKYREQFDGEAWTPVLYSHKVNRVLDPLPPVAPGPLFANTRTP